MRKGTGHATLCGLIAGGLFFVASFAEENRRAGADFLQIEVPFEPTAFASAGSTYSAYELVPPKVDGPMKLQRVATGDAHRRNSETGVRNIYLAYELILTNTASAPRTLTRIEIADGNRRQAKPAAVYEGSELEARLACPDRRQAETENNRLQLQPGERCVVILFLSFQDGKRAPATLRHRVYTTDTVIEAPLVRTDRTRMPVLGPPLKGGAWFVMGGPGATGATTYHRQNTYILDGKPEAARRYAIDWVKIEQGEMHSGNYADTASFYGYGQEILAVADSLVVTAVDGVPDNVPGHVPSFNPAAPVCMLCGNHVVLELAPGQFATYLHLQPGSLRVAKGDRVRRGQVLGRVGNSGESFVPHLHFQITTEPGMRGQGLPYLIERFSIIDGLGVAHPRTRELPLDAMVIDFGSWLETITRPRARQ